MPMKKSCAAVALFLCLLGSCLAAADDKPTSLSDARAAIDANLKTPEGKAYDEKLGQEFQEKYLGTMKHCKQAAGNDLDSFWMLLKLDKDGAVKEVLLYPTTSMGTCARKSLLKDRFSAPPKPDYWVGVYMKITKR